MISLATLRRARYLPELLPGAFVQDLSAGSLGPPILELRDFAPLWVRLIGLALPRDADVDYRLRTERSEDAVRLSGVLDRVPGREAVTAREHIRLALYARANKTAFTGTYRLLVYEPTVADKIATEAARRRAVLSAEEARLASEKQVRDRVQGGLLPLPWPPDDYTFQRRYGSYRYSELPRVLSAQVTTEQQLLHVEPAEPGSFVALTALAMTPGTAAEGVQVVIERDEDYDYLQLPALPFSLDRDLECFVPARREIRVKAWAASPAALTIRLTFGFYHEVLAHRVRWGLVPRDQAPADLWDEIKAGIR